GRGCLFCALLFLTYASKLITPPAELYSIRGGICNPLSQAPVGKYPRPTPRGGAPRRGEAGTASRRGSGAQGVIQIFKPRIDQPSSAASPRVWNSAFK